MRRDSQANKQQGKNQYDPSRQISQTYSTVPSTVYQLPSNPPPIYPPPPPLQYYVISQVQQQGGDSSALIGATNGSVMGCRDEQASLRSRNANRQIKNNNLEAHFKNSCREQTKNPTQLIRNKLTQM